VGTSHEDLRGPVRHSSVEKIQTLVEGLDEILHGGIPKGSMTLFSGGPGTGKTMLALEVLVRRAIDGIPGVFVTFEEREKDLQSYADGFGWDLAALKEAGKLAIISARIQPDSILAGEFDLRGILSILRAQITSIGAQCVVIDAPDAFLRLLDDIGRERAELQLLHEWLRDSDLTSIMTVKSKHEGASYLHYEFLDYLADCVLYLDQRVVDQVTTRRLRVVKYRGSSYGRNEYPFGITDQGTWIIPVTQASLKHRALGKAISSGVPALDALMAGGYRRSSCTLISGGSGTGKTTFAASFVLHATEQGERVLYLDFEESWDALVSCMLSPGLDLRPALETGMLRFVSTMPESQGIEEHLIQAFRAIAEFQPQHLIVDAISACRRMGSAHAAFDYLLRLIDRSKQLGITALLTNLSATDQLSQEITGIDLSSVIDTVILLRNVEIAGAYRREMAIIKSRGRDHSHHVHPFQITGNGIAIGEGRAE